MVRGEFKRSHSFYVILLHISTSAANANNVLNCAVGEVLFNPQLNHSHCQRPYSEAF